MPLCLSLSSRKVCKFAYLNSSSTIADILLLLIDAILISVVYWRMLNKMSTCLKISWS
jgi:hypothetical protein